MAAIQISIRGQGNVPDSAVAEIRTRVKALVQACMDAGAPEHFLRVDFSPADDPALSVAAAPLAHAPAEPPVAEPVVAEMPFEAAVLERPHPTGRAAVVPPTVKPPVADAKSPVPKEVP